MTRRLAAELFGTFVLVFAGTGAIVFDSVNPGKIGHIGIALTFGLVVLSMAYAVGSVSGAHLNPAVTVGLWAARRVPGRQVLPFVFAGPISGASMNSARSLAPAVASGSIQHLWVYLVAPIVGAALALPTCALIQQPGCCREGACR